jgi:hypothetical protein
MAGFCEMPCWTRFTKVQICGLRRKGAPMNDTEFWISSSGPIAIALVALGAACVWRAAGETLYDATRAVERRIEGHLASAAECSLEASRTGERLFLTWASWERREAARLRRRADRMWAIVRYWPWLQ